MNIKEYLLLDEMKRLSRINDNLEKGIRKTTGINNEFEQITENVESMCNIANTICNVHKNHIMKKKKTNICQS